jgi:hypothetical protein
MKEFLSSPKVSLGCAAINAVFALSSLINGSWMWFFICAALSGFCFNNYYKD